jgi:hypothetical protein
MQYLFLWWRFFDYTARFAKDMVETGSQRPEQFVVVANECGIAGLFEQKIVNTLSIFLG